MTSCTDIQDALSAYVDRELPAPERAGIDAHLKRCAACRALLEELTAVDRFLCSEATPASAADLKAKLSRELDGDFRASGHAAPRRTPQPMPVPVPPARWYAAPAALLAVAAATIAVVAMMPAQMSKTTPEPAPAPPKVAQAVRVAPVAPVQVRTSPPAPAAHAKIRAELAAIARGLDAMDRDVKTFRADAVREAGAGHQRVISRRFEEWK